MSRPTIAALQRALRIADGGVARKETPGEPCFDNAALLDGDAVMGWLSRHGVPGVRDEYEANLKWRVLGRVREEQPRGQ